MIVAHKVGAIVFGNVGRHINSVSVVPLGFFVSKRDLCRLTKSSCEDEEFHFRVWGNSLSHISFTQPYVEMTAFG